MTIKEDESYLGDGVYARYDGFVWLRTPRDQTDHEIALEPEVIAALVRFIADLREKFPGRIIPAWEYLLHAVSSSNLRPDAADD